ncbi:hypothetical protein GCG54_00007926 [Colletotrichum gloeosporioides]|uniref:Uncharacterized protein n=1 Tax=Colletotrichum gloeosporioides TaxID=474922 RepID=A0A8H4FP80_COLGL|nr:uncharacterized protein GCG54_00007926 [Colletotrichum gloeosporioides]KAF3808144.1 hypothetical protein GCG54_00007926 [Colletotrichum gloeosporioides]
MQASRGLGVRRWADFADDNCPVCLIKAGMTDPGGGHMPGDPDFWAKRLIDLVLKTRDDGEHPKPLVLRYVLQWCRVIRRIEELKICRICWTLHVDMTALVNFDTQRNAPSDEMSDDEEARPVDPLLQDH